MNDKVLLVFDCFGVVIHWVSEFWMAQFPNWKELRPTILKYFEEGDRGQITNEELMQKLSKLTGEDPLDIMNDWNRYAKPLPDMLEFLQRIKGKYHTEMLSNASSGFLNKILDKYNLRPLFDNIIISSDYHIAKPDKEIFDLAISKVKGNFDFIFMIDDNPINTEAAKQSGMIGIVYHNQSDFEKELGKYIEI